MSTFVRARGTPLLGHLLRAGSDRLGLMSHLARQHGGAVLFSLGPRTIHFISDPELADHVLSTAPGRYVKGIGLTQARSVLGDGLLTSSGARWQRQRRSLAPALRPDRVRGSANIIIHESQRMATAWDAGATGVPQEVEQEITRFTMAVLGHVVLGAAVPDPQGLRKAMDVVQRSAMFELLTLGAIPRWVPTRGRRQLRDATRLLHQTAKDLLSRADPENTSTFLHDLVRRRETESLPEDEAIAELVTLLLAGHETSASTLSWALYELSKDQEQQSAARMEAQEAWARQLSRGLGEGAGFDLRELPVVTAVVHEVLRLHPPVWLVSRRCIEADLLGGRMIRPGDDVVISPYVMHRRSELWDLPETFDHRRFLHSDAGSRFLPVGYLPFGDGPRGCVGSTLAMVEVVTALVVLLCQLRFAPAENPVHAVADLSLRPGPGLAFLMTKVV